MKKIAEITVDVVRIDFEKFKLTKQDALEKSYREPRCVLKSRERKSECVIFVGGQTKLKEKSL